MRRKKQTNKTPTNFDIHLFFFEMKENIEKESLSPGIVIWSARIHRLAEKDRLDCSALQCRFQGREDAGSIPGRVVPKGHKIVPENSTVQHSAIKGQN